MRRRRLMRMATAPPTTTKGVLCPLCFKHETREGQPFNTRGRLSMHLVKGHNLRKKEVYALYKKHGLYAERGFAAPVPTSKPGAAKMYAQNWKDRMAKDGWPCGVCGKKGFANYAQWRKHRRDKHAGQTRHRTPVHSGTVNSALPQLNAWCEPYLDGYLVRVNANGSGPIMIFGYPVDLVVRDPHQKRRRATHAAA